jgi:hypothetical protein
MGRVYFNARRESHALDGAYTVKASDSGKVFMLSATGGTVAITLPTLSGTGDDLAVAGLYYKFIVEEDTPANAITIGAGSTVIDIVGVDIAQNDGPSSAGTAKSNLIFGTACKQGDYIDIFHDGTTWYAESMSSTAGSITTS